MPLSDAEPLVRQIHTSGRQIVLCLTGGGSQAIADLLVVPGGSRSIWEATVPYSPAALDSYLGGPPDQYCAEPTARRMAMRALERGRAGGVSLAQLVGVGVTASLASDRPKRGAHRAYAAVQTASFTASVSLELVKDARSRREEEAIVAKLVLNALAEGCGLKDRLPLELLPGEQPVSQRTEARESWQALLSGNQRAVCESGTTAAPKAIFPGSFNPRHDGHRRMAAMAAEILGVPVAHEISVANVDKPLLDYQEIQSRCVGFAPDETLWLTCAPTFVEKAELFPAATFIVGADTIRRIAEPKYYGGDALARDRAITRLSELGSRFLVFGRVDDGRFETLEDLTLPSELKSLCRAVAAEDFRQDVSSTELREGNQGT